MKILVVNLLRLGDFLLTVPVLNGLREKYPKARLDVWVHRPVTQLSPLLPVVNQWHVLDRDELQAGLGQSEIPFLSSFDVLREQCDAISTENYDLVINLTQTRFSGYLMGYIRAKAKLGLTIEASGHAHFHSPWFRYLNDRAESTDGDILHYTDIFSEASEVYGERSWKMAATVLGHAEASVVKESPSLIAVQPFTSDSKKNWPLESWTQAIAELIQALPQSQFVLLGAPNEAQALEGLAKSVAPEFRSRVQPFVCSLDGALAILERSRLLITGDTSIKHLANAAGTQVVELSLGSSDFRRTGAFTAGSVILQPILPCSPCRHSVPCSQSSHLCAVQLSIETVVGVVQAVLRNDETTLLALAESQKGRVQVRKTAILGNGFWFARDILNSRPAETVQSWIERSVTKFLYRGAEKSPLPAFGTEIYRLTEDIRHLNATEPVLARLDFLETATDQRRQKAAAERRLFQPLPAEKRDVLDIAPIRARQSKLELEEREIQIQSKLIRTLKAHLTEKT